ncbi:MAG: hypothetical protein AVDCRST_MAG67-3533, partial [uncultured Solirubrobacteraceae bacterium]
DAEPDAQRNDLRGRRAARGGLVSRDRPQARR